MKKYSRRSFINTLGATGGGILVAPYLKSDYILAYSHLAPNSYKARVAITQADAYTRSLIKQKIQYLFGLLDGIGDLVSAGKKVAIKINLTGGGNDIDHMFTHPEVLR